MEQLANTLQRGAVSDAELHRVAISSVGELQKQLASQSLEFAELRSKLGTERQARERLEATGVAMEQLANTLQRGAVSDAEAHRVSIASIGELQKQLASQSLELTELRSKLGTERQARERLEATAAPIPHGAAKPRTPISPGKPPSGSRRRLSQLRPPDVDIQVSSASTTESPTSVRSNTHGVGTDTELLSSQLPPSVDSRWHVHLQELEAAAGDYVEELESVHVRQESQLAAAAEGQQKLHVHLGALERAAEEYVAELEQQMVEAASDAVMAAATIEQQHVELVQLRMVLSEQQKAIDAATAFIEEHRFPREQQTGQAVGGCGAVLEPSPANLQSWLWLAAPNGVYNRFWGSISESTQTFSLWKNSDEESPLATWSVRDGEASAEDRAEDSYLHMLRLTLPGSENGGRVRYTKTVLQFACATGQERREWHRALRAATVP
jgi:hypothetical protein